MWIVAAASLIFSGFIVYTGRTVTGSMELTSGDRGVKGTETGVFVAVGVLAFLAGTFLFGPAPNAAPSTKGGAVPTLTNAPSSPSPISSAATATPTSSGGATTAQPTNLPTETPSPAASVGPPWIGVESNLRLYVEKALIDKQSGRVVLTVRLENNSDVALAMTADNFRAVDQNQHSYGADNPKSTLIFDNDESALSGYNPNGPFPAGTTRAGTVFLDSQLESGAKTLQVRFTVALQSPSNLMTIEHFTVHADGVVPVAAGK
jgi:hypothetical protein